MSGIPWLSSQHLMESLVGSIIRLKLVTPDLVEERQETVVVEMMSARLERIIIVESVQCQLMTETGLI